MSPIGDSGKVMPLWLKNYKYSLPTNQAAFAKLRSEPGTHYLGAACTIIYSLVRSEEDLQHLEMIGPR
jgi:hypothetical protein